MNYYFIYSAGGGAGDWNGVKRMWAEYMPETLKSKILLKFGDIFLEHASGNNFIRPQRWRDINNLREWLSENVNDEFVESQACDILLDSGTAKAVNMIAHHNPRVSCERLIELFNKAFEDNRVFEKYTQIVHASQLNSAVTFDIPNPFKIRSQNGAARLNIIDQETNSALVRLSVAYANRMYEMFVALGGTDYANNTLSTIVNGLWSEEEMDIFFSGLNYSPRKLAVGGLSSTSVSETDIRTQMAILQKFDVLSFDKVHFLGCGGFKKVKAIKDCDIDGDNIFVMVQELELRPYEQARLELHRKYIDIQLVLRGKEEVFGWSEKKDCLTAETEFDEAKDIQLFTDKPQCFYTVREGQFSILFPEDGHAPMLGEGVVKKCIFKILL